jgi:ABC-2 type transport system permease protein
MYFFPDIWQNVLFFASIRYFLLFPAIIVIILVTNEFTFKTIRQNIINGMSRKEFLLSKLQVLFWLSVIITVILTIMVLILGLSNTADPTASMVFSKIVFVPGFFIQIFSFLVFAFFAGFMLRSTGLAIGIFTLYALIIEPVFYYVLKIPKLQPNTISQYLPVNSVLKVIEYPKLASLTRLMGLHLQEDISLLDCSIPLLYAAIMIWIVFMTIKKKDL